MALIAENKGFSSPDEDATDCVYLTGAVWGSEAPKTHLMFGMGNSINAVNTNIKSSFGWSDDTDNVSIGVGSDNGVGTTVCNRAHQNAYNIYPLADNGALYERAVQQSYSNAPRVCNTWSSTSTDGYNYFLWALGGSDVTNISIDEVTSPGSTGDVSYTGPGFQPDFLIVMHSVATALPLASVHVVAGLGMSDGTTDAYVNAGSRDAVTTSFTNSRLSGKFIHYYNIISLAEYETAVVKSLDSSGYTLTWELVSGTNRKYTIIAVKGPQAKVITTTQPTSNTTNDLDAGFVPKAGLCIGAMKTASASPSDHNRFMLGVWDEQDNMDCGGWMDENGVTTTNADRFITNSYSVVNYNHSQSIVGSATVAAYNNGIRETWTNTDGTQYAHSWLLLGEEATDFPEIQVTGLSDNVITDGDTTPTTADGTDFGSVTKNDSTVTRTFKVANSGALALTTETPTVPTGFTLTEGLSTSIATSGNDTFSVRLDNSVVGIKHGNISFVNNDSDHNPFNFAVSGVVNEANFAEISVTGLGDNVITDGDTTPTTTDGTDFGSVTQNDSTVTRTFKVSNSGAIALTTETPSVPTGFTLTEGLATSIATSGNDTFSVRLDNSVVGVKHGTISFVNNDTTLNPFNFTVSGVVTAAAETPATSTGITSIISSGLSQLNTGNSLVSVAGAKGLGASGTLITEITNTNRLDRTINEPGAPIGVLDSRFEDRMDETSYYAGSGAYWGSAR